jgi:putative peptidoglycan lipid II flippase
VAVNLITCLALLLALQRTLGSLPLRRWGLDSLLLVAAAAVAGLAAWWLSWAVNWPAGLLGGLLQCGFSTAVALALYGALATSAGVPEARQLSQQVLQRLRRRS